MIYSGCVHFAVWQRLRKGSEMHDLFFLYFVCPRAVEEAFSKALYMSKGYAKTRIDKEDSSF